MKRYWSLLGFITFASIISFRAEGQPVSSADPHSSISVSATATDHQFALGSDRLEKNPVTLDIAILLTTVLLLLMAALTLSMRKSIKRRERDIRQIIDLLPLHIFARDDAGKYILCNKSTAESMGRKLSDIIGKTPSELRPDDPNNQMYIREDQQVLSNATSINFPETVYNDHTGARRVLKITKVPFHYRNGVPTAVLCAAVDITLLKDAEEKAKNSGNNLMVILNSIADGVVAIDNSGHIVFFNRVMETMTEKTMAEAAGLHIAEVLSLKDSDDAPVDMAELINQAFESKEDAGLAYQIYLHAKGESKRNIALKWSVINFSEHESGLAIVLTDITDELIISKKLHETQKMESIGRLAGGVAHDFNNLLAGIVGYTELLSLNLPNHEENQSYLKGIFESSERARDLIQELLTFSRRHPSENRPVDIRTIIGHVTSLLQHTLDRRIEIINRTEASSYIVLGDRSQLQNAVLNLGVNARDAMPMGGTLSFITANRLLSRADCDKLPFELTPGLYIEIKVIDTGKGIEKETLSHIFEPFFTTRLSAGGTGLGLAAVYGTFKEHHGYIDVNSQPGKGSEFTLGLPIYDEKIDDSAEDKDAADLKGSGKILIIDDEVHILKTMEAILQSLGYETVSATNGRDAITIFAEAEGRFDLIILDMIMPELTGEQTYRELRKIKEDVKVLVASGFLQEHNISDLLDIGILSVIHKPFRMDELARRVKLSINSRI